MVLKKEKSGWFVNDTIPARKDIVQVLLETLKRIEVKSPVNKPMREHVMTWGQSRTASEKDDPCLL